MIRMNDSWILKHILVRQTKELNLILLKSTATVVSPSFSPSVLLVLIKCKCEAWNPNKWILSMWSLPTLLQLVQRFSRIACLCSSKLWTLYNWVIISLSCCNHTFLVIIPLPLNYFGQHFNVTDQVIFHFHLSPGLNILDFTAFSVSPLLQWQC